MRKNLSPEEIRDVCRKLCLIFTFTELAPSDLEKSSRLQWDDFEDGLQAAAAERVGADFIITRNQKDFKNASVPAASPEEFLKLLTPEKKQ